MRYVLIAVALHTVALAGIEIELPFNDLVKQADSILLARVLSVRSEQANSAIGKSRVTVVVFAVERLYKGLPLTRMTLRLPGGTLGGISQNVEGVPIFVSGARDLLFLKRDSTSSYSLLGGVQGRYHIDIDVNDRRQYVRPDYPQNAKSIPLSEFEGRLRQNLAQVR